MQNFIQRWPFYQKLWIKGSVTWVFASKIYIPVTFNPPNINTDKKYAFLTNFSHNTSIGPYKYEKIIYKMILWSMWLRFSKNMYFGLFWQKTTFFYNVWWRHKKRATILKIFLHNFVDNMTMYHCAKFHIKIIFLSGVMAWGHIVPPPPTVHRGPKSPQ